MQTPDKYTGGKIYCAPKVFSVHENRDMKTIHSTNRIDNNKIQCWGRCEEMDDFNPAKRRIK